MSNMIRRLLSALALLTWSTAALAQSGCPSIVTGAVLTAGQWQSCFSAKQDTLGYTPLNRAGGSMTGPLITFASSASNAGLRIPPGTAPTTPTNGDTWTTTAGMFVRINGVTIGPLGGATSTSFSATLPLAVTFPAGVVNYALNFDSNFVLSGSNLALASIASGNLIANSTAGSAEPTSATPSAWLSRWCSGTTGAFPTATGASTWGCGTTGTSGHVVPYLDGANTWSAVQQFNSGNLLVKGSSSGTLDIRVAAAAGTSVLTFPAGTTNFSATGGASQVIKQVSAGAPLTVAQLAAADLSNGVSGSGAVVLASRSISAGAGLAGGGDLSADRTIASNRPQNAQTGTTYTVLNGDQSKIVTFSNASSIAVTLPQAGGGGSFLSGWEADLVNIGAGTVTITPATSTINGQASYVLTTGQGVHLFSNGTNYFANAGAAVGAGTGTVTSVVCATTTITNSGTCYARGQIVGTNTNDNATAGNFGEYISSNVPSGSAVSIATGVPKTVTSISLTAGDWDVHGNVGTIVSGATTAMIVSISLVDNTSAISPNGGAYVATNDTASTVSPVIPVGVTRLSLASTTMVYLVTSVAFTSTASVYGFIGARRAR